MENQITNIFQQLLDINKHLGKLESLPSRLEAIEALVQKKLTSFEENLKFTNAKYEEQRVQNEELKKEVAAVRKENGTILAENCQLRKQCATIATSTDAMENYSRRNNLEISGLPETEGENPDSAVIAIAQVVGVTISENDIDAAHRVPTKKREGIKPLIVKFISRRVRDKLQKAVRERRPAVKAVLKNHRSEKDLIFANDHLSPGRKDLFIKTLEKKRSTGAKFVWTRNNIVFYRHDESAKVFKIDSEQDLEKIR